MEIGVATAKAQSAKARRTTRPGAGTKPSSATDRSDAPARWSRTRPHWRAREITAGPERL